MSISSVSVVLLASIGLLACGQVDSQSTRLSAEASSYLLSIEADENTLAVLDGLESEAEITYMASKKGDGCGDGSFVQLPYAPWWPNYVYQPKMERSVIRLEREGQSVQARLLDRRAERCGFAIYSIDLPTLSILDQAPRLSFTPEAAQGTYVSTCLLSEKSFDCSSVNVHPQSKTIRLQLKAQL